jgi:hypothetical protein
MKRHRRVRIKIRFAYLPLKIESQMRRAFSTSQMMSKLRREKNKETMVVLLELDDSVDCDKLCQFIDKYKIPLKNCTLRVSIVTDQYMDGVLVPEVIRNLWCRLGCDLTFTFTTV